MQDFRKLSWSIFIVLSWSIFIVLSKDSDLLLLIQLEITFFILCLEKMNLPRGETPLPLLNKVEDEDPISPVRTPVEFILFFIIETPTTNQGKRGSMSYILLFH
jgi:hypothetical protein